MPTFEPVPLKDIKLLPYSLQEWFRKIQLTFAAGIAWVNIDFTGSNITDILTRRHEDLQDLQGGAAGDYFHLLETEHDELTDGGDTTLHFHSADRSDSFKTIQVSGQSDVVADSPTDTLTLAAGSNITLTTNAGTDTVTIAAASGGNSFGTIAVSGQSDIVADTSADTLTIAAGSNITLTTNAGTDTLTIAASGGGISSGTSFPGSPSTNDLFFRTDRSLIYFYNGTRWLTISQYTFPLSLNGAIANKTVSTVTVAVGAPALCPTYDFWVDTFEASTYVNSGNTGSAYWDVVLTKYQSLVQSTVATISTGTAPDANNVIQAHQVAVGALLGTTTDAMVIDVVKVSTPGAFQLFSGTMTGRLVG